MSQRFWVGGTANWDSTAGSKWATTSGGAGGAAVPTASDDVYFDANSGAGTVTVAVSSYMDDLDFTGFTGTFAGTGALSVYGNLKLVAGMTFTHTGAITMYAEVYSPSAGKAVTATIAGKTLGAFGVAGYNSSSSVTLQDDLIVTNAFGFGTNTAGKFYANNKNVTVGGFYAAGSGTMTLDMGSGTWTITSNKATGSRSWYITATSLTLTASTSTLKMTYTGATTYFYGGGKTYYKLWLYGNPTLYALSDTFTCGEIVIDRTLGNQSIRITTGKTVTATTWTATLNGTNTITFRSSTTTNATIAKAGGGTVQTYYIDADYITGSPAGTFYVGNTISSVDGGHNSQLYFTSPSITNPTYAYADDANYATGTSASGVVYVQLSWDAGTTWTSAKSVTFTGSETTEVYGDGETELWGRTWSGDDVDDTSFRLRIMAPFWQRIYKTYGFSPGAGITLTGIKVSVKGKWDGSTASINYIPVAIYYGSSPIPVKAGSMAFASDGRKAGEGVGAGSGVLTFYDGTNWIACDTGAAVDD